MRNLNSQVEAHNCTITGVLQAEGTVLVIRSQQIAVLLITRPTEGVQYSVSAKITD